MPVLLVSCPRGGLFRFDTEALTLSCMHQTVTDVHTGLRRFGEEYLWVYGGTDLVRVDKNGVIQDRIELGTFDAHEVCVDGEKVYVSDTQQNRLLVFDDQLVRQGYIPLFDSDDKIYQRDICHLNGVTAHQDRLYVTMFVHPNVVLARKEPQFEEWRRTVNSGVLCMYKEGEFQPLLLGLWQPHTLRFWRDFAVICNSGFQKICLYSTHTFPWHLVRIIETPGYYPRGVFCHEDGFYCGMSVVRGIPDWPERNAALANISWTGDIKERWQFPVREIFDVEGIS